MYSVYIYGVAANLFNNSDILHFPKTSNTAIKMNFVYPDDENILNDQNSKR